MEKAIVSGTAGTVPPDSRRPPEIDLCTPEETTGGQGGSRALVFQGDVPARATDEENHRSVDGKGIREIARLQLLPA